MLPCFHCFLQEISKIAHLASRNGAAIKILEISLIYINVLNILLMCTWAEKTESPSFMDLCLEIPKFIYCSIWLYFERFSSRFFGKFAKVGNLKILYDEYLFANKYWNCFNRIWFYFSWSPDCLHKSRILINHQALPIHFCHTLLHFCIYLQTI